MPKEPTKVRRRSNQLTGVAGEYYVAAELSRRGYVASISLRNTDSIDILASNHDGSRTIAIQVKTRSDHYKKWPLNFKAESMFNPKLFYVFVNLNGDRSVPEFHIVKSKAVADFVRDGHKNWLQTPGKKGQKHNDTDMRQFEDRESRYRDRWDLLSL
jgi:hypothetical protein